MSATGVIVASIIGVAGTVVTGVLNNKSVDETNRMSMGFAEQERADQLRRTEIEERLKRAQLREQARSNRANEALREREIGFQELQGARSMMLGQLDRAVASTERMFNGDRAIKNDLLNVWARR